MSKKGDDIYRSEIVQKYLQREGYRYRSRPHTPSNWRVRVWHIIGPHNETVCQKPLPRFGDTVEKEGLPEGAHICVQCGQGADPERPKRMQERWSRGFSNFKD